MSLHIKSILQRTWIVLFFVFSVYYILSQYAPPIALPESAPACEFSADRAWKHIEAATKVTHPAGSDANRVVHDYIVGQIKSMGLEPVLEERTEGGEYSSYSPWNIMVRISGTNPTRAFAACAHFDSVPFGPGSADDFAGCAALLETIRALKASKPLRNDVIFLFTDGEEVGLCGAKLFTSHPWAKEIEIIFNMDCRGNDGPSFIYETHDNNGWLIDQLAVATKSLMASSMMYDISKRMPTASDFKAFRLAGMKGMNAAFLFNLPHYHSQNDNADNIHRDSLQHHGNYTLNFARHFGSIDLRCAPCETNQVYFNTIGNHFVHYDTENTNIFILIASISLISLGMVGFILKFFTIDGVLKGWTCTPLSMLAVVTITEIFVGLAYCFHGLYMLYLSPTYSLSLALIAIASVMAIFSKLADKISLYDLTLSGLFWVLGFTIIMHFLLPLGSYIFLWPLSFSSLGLLIAFISCYRTRKLGMLSYGIIALFSIPAMVLIVPKLHGLIEAVTLLGAPPVLVSIVILMNCCFPLVLAVQPAGCKFFSVGIASLGIGIFIFALATNQFSALNPKMDYLSYVLNADTQEAFWISNDQEKDFDVWLSQYFSQSTPRVSLEEFFHGYTAPYLKSKAPVASIPQSSFEVVSDITANNRRTLRLKATVHSANMHIYADAECYVESASVNGHPIKGGKNWFYFCIIPPRSKFLDIVIKTEANKAFQWKVVDVSYPIPMFPEYRPRPAWIITKPNTMDLNRSHIKSNSSLCLKRWTF